MEIVMRVKTRLSRCKTSHYIFYKQSEKLRKEKSHHLGKYYCSSAGVQHAFAKLTV